MQSNQMCYDMVLKGVVAFFRSNFSKPEKKLLHMACTWLCIHRELSRNVPGTQEAQALATSLPLDAGWRTQYKVHYISTLPILQREHTNCSSLQEDNGQAYRSCELKVSFKSIYQECLVRAKEHFAAKPVEESVEALPEPESAEPEPLDPRAGYSGEAEDAELPIRSEPRIKGPQLPGATVGANIGGDSESESDEAAGPRGEGEERQGVDLRYMDAKKPRREEWMTSAPERIFAALVHLTIVDTS